MGCIDFKSFLDLSPTKTFKTRFKILMVCYQRHQK
jgi:hypothetical protein